MKSIRALLEGAVDYAGLFPPAKLDMETAVRNYAAYRAGEYAWALGRLIVPVSRLTEFDRAIAEIRTGDVEPWKLSALVGPKVQEEIASVLDFNKSHGDVATIETVELKADTAEDVEAAAKVIPSSLTAFVEIPLEPDPSELVNVIGSSGLRAKARTGGITAEAFPASTVLARFIHACVAANVRFKATAGLHHPLRAKYRITYEPDGPTGMMFGFLNVFVATGVARTGGSIADITAALEEQSRSTFLANDQEILWRTYRIDMSQITLLRSELATSFGSCSFAEPIDDLKSLNLL